MIKTVLMPTAFIRITGEYDNNGKVETGADWPAPMAKALKEDFPEVEKSDA